MARATAKADHYPHTEETVKAALYARVSTTNGQDPTVQTRELKEYCQRRGWKLSGEYVYTGISGAR